MTEPWTHPNPLTVSFSSLSTLEYCMRRFEFFKFYNNIPRYRSMDGDIGKAMHAGYQNYLATKDRDSGVMELIRKFPIDMCGDPLHVRSLEACYTTLLRVYDDFNLLEYEVAQVHCLDGVVRPAIEVEFEIWLDGVTICERPVVYVGYIDCILFNIITGTLRVADLKTTRNDNDQTANFLFHEQCLPYGLVLQQLAGKSFDRFDVSYISAYIDLLEPKVSTYTFTKTLTDVSDWYQTLFYKIKRVKEHAESGWFPRRGGGCMVYRDETCQFIQACRTRDKQQAQAFIAPTGAALEKPPVRNPWMRFRLEMNIDSIQGKHNA